MQSTAMITALWIIGGVWFALSAMFVLALCAAARNRHPVEEPMPAEAQTTSATPVRAFSC